MRGRVLFLTSSYPRWPEDAAGPFISHLAQDLSALGWEVTVLAPHAPGATILENAGGVQVHRFRYAWPARLQTLCYGGGTLANLRHNPANYFLIPSLLGCQWSATRQLLGTGAFHLLHSHWLIPQTLVGGLAARRFSVPHIATVHGSDALALRSPFLRRLKIAALKSTCAVTVNSSVTCASIKQIAPKDTELEVIPMGATVPVQDRATRDATAALRARLRRSTGPLLAFVGRLVEEKGADDLIMAVRSLTARGREVSAVIVGDGPEHRKLAKLAVRLGVAERVAFVGPVAHREVQFYIGAADVFIAPSRTSDRGGVEAQGLTIAEAMLAGTAVIATRCGGIVDHVLDGITGILIPENSPEQLADAVDRVVADVAGTAAIRERAYLHASTRLTRSATATAFDSLYTELVGRFRPAASRS